MSLSDDAKRILIAAAQNGGTVKVWGDRYQSALNELKRADLIQSTGLSSYTNFKLK